MTGFTSLYGIVLMLALIVGGLVFMVAPQAGGKITKRVGVSMLLFFCGGYALRCQGGSLLSRSAWTVVAAGLFLAAVLSVPAPSAAAALVRRIGTFGLVLLALYILFAWVWKGRIG